VNQSSDAGVLVMTGSTSGIGAHAVRRIAEQPGARVIIGARGSERAGPDGAEVLPLDLASLANVREFADAVARQLGEDRVDMLVLNAGAQYRRADQRSADGFELTFAVNHLSHYLLARLLLPAVADGGRIVVTTSDAHDPRITSHAPTRLDIEEWAHPVDRSSGFRAYAASKLCNLLATRSLAALEDVNARGITVIAYNPGLTGGTSLTRAQPAAMRMMTRLARPLFLLAARVRPQFHMGTAERAGEALAQLSVGTATPPPGRVYASLVRGEITYPDPSELAQSDDARDQLWRDSEAMLGMRP
jgi:NAD(P)-dependent dehydrogenase (short-subunit alcohol dehydrogenase family)